MKKSWSAWLLSALFLALLPGSPAGADHEAGHYSDPPAGCEADAEACYYAAEATVTPDAVEPGGTVIATAAAGTFAPETTADGGIVAYDGRVIVEVRDLTVNPDGSVSFSITVPEGTPSDVYVLYIHGSDQNGNPVVAMVDLIVLPATTKSASPPQGGSGGVPGATAPPAANAALDAMTPEERASAVEAVANGTGTVVLNGAGDLELRTADAAGSSGARDGSVLSRTGNLLAGPLVAAIALILVGSGMLVLRRRPARHA